MDRPRSYTTSGDVRKRDCLRLVRGHTHYRSDGHGEEVLIKSTALICTNEIVYN